MTSSAISLIITKVTKYIKSFTCWNQLLVLMFGQLSGRESLRDVIVAVEAHQAKAYGLGVVVQLTVPMVNIT